MDVTHPGSEPLDAVRGEVATLMQGQRFSLSLINPLPCSGLT